MPKKSQELYILETVVNPNTLSIIVPALNEQEYLPLLINQLESTLIKFEDINFTIVLVDDGSTDKTWEVCKGIASVNPNVMSIRLLKNFGKEVAILVGLYMNKSRLYAVLDADGQHDPIYLLEMLRLINKEDLDLVIGERIDYRPKNLELLTNIYYLIIQRIALVNYAKLCDYSVFTYALRNYVLSKTSLSLVFKMLIYEGVSRKSTLPIKIKTPKNRIRRWRSTALFSKGMNSIYHMSTVAQIIYFLVVTTTLLAILTVFAGFWFNSFVLHRMVPPGYITLIGLNLVLIIQSSAFLLIYTLNSRKKTIPSDLSQLVSDWFFQVSE